LNLTTYNPALAATGDGVDDAFYVQRNGNAHFAGDVGIGTTGPNDKLEVAGFTRTYGIRTAAMTTGAEMVYIRGTGYNNLVHRLVKIGNTTYQDSTGRGLTFCIFTAADHSLVGCTRYDTYSVPGDSDNLATAMNDLQRTQIGILASYDAWEANVTNNLRAAARRLGLFKLGSYVSGGSRRPYAAIFYGSGTASANTEPPGMRMLLMQL
jgi:hypothetical protein